MKRNYILVVFLLACQVAFAQVTWKIDPLHSKISFGVAHMVVSEVEGNFKEFEGTIVAPSPDDFGGASVTFTAQTASIDTDNAKRDEHLRGEDFFEVKKFPVISFKGKLMRDRKTYQLQGQLTMKGVTREVSYETTYRGSIDTGRGVKAGFKLNGVVNRQDYGLKWRRALASGEFVVGDEVTIKCTLELDKVE